jgi:integrase
VNLLIQEASRRRHRTPQGNAARIKYYGQANGFTCHSLRHTFVTDMMEATGNAVALVMSYSGHKSIESFKIYLHLTQKGRILANQRMNAVGDFLGTFSGIEGTPGMEGTTASTPKRLKRKKVAV